MRDHLLALTCLAVFALPPAGCHVDDEPPDDPPVVVVEPAATDRANDADAPETPEPPTVPFGELAWMLVGDVEASACPAGSLDDPIVYVALGWACGDWVTEPLELQATVASKTRYFFQVPDGTHYLQAFVDCNGNADPDRPLPGAGDLVYAPQNEDGELQRCRIYRLNGRGFVEIPITIGEPFCRSPGD